MNKYEQLKQYNLVVDSLREDLDREPEPEEIYSATGMNPKEFSNLRIDEDEDEHVELVFRLGVVNNSLKKARLKRGLLQTEVSDKLGWPKQRYSGIERCIAYPDKKERQQLVVLFETTESKIFPAWLQIFTDKWKRTEKNSVVTMNHESLCSSELLMLEAEPTMGSVVDRVAAKKTIEDALEKANLTPRFQKILEMRYGLLDGVSHTLEEVGKEFDVSRDRIRQIEMKALEKMKDVLPINLFL